MKAKERFHAIILSLTTAIIVFVWNKFGDQIEFPGIIVFLSGGFISIATYKLLFEILKFIFSKSRIIRLLLLRKEYMEGTWVGFYIGLEGNVRFIIEEFYQDLDGIIVKGTGYNEEKNIHASWNSDIVKIDTKSRLLLYLYNVTPIHQTYNGVGIANFDLNEVNFWGASKRITGYTADNHNGVRVKSFEIKISSKHSISKENALERAEQFYTNMDNL